ncbi:SHOCT domain-containing protein [Haloarcula nitratireducens]|uniref:SHOCT domain-containing protein n=1 Tax=Haloarcula nitratireducens TaxID=2487749 RepID=A0AAW4PJ39_9EURY|nr:SHOCT domain-containing protein [Halomicroarcula nitratireducens]MBX0297964.1 SHOCT domain-containing protein [Halomicroarcula nitratireducens]
MSTERTSDSLLRIVLIVLAVIVLFPLLMMVFAMPMMGMMGWWWGGGIAGGLSPLWGIGMMLVWLVILVGIGYLLYRGLVGRVGSSMANERALEELRVAYARGDLSEEEFEKRRANLSREKS